MKYFLCISALVTLSACATPPDWGDYALAGAALGALVRK